MPGSSTVGYGSTGHAWSGLDGYAARTVSSGGSELLIFVPRTVHSHDFGSDSSLTAPDVHSEWMWIIEKLHLRFGKTKSMGSA
jgi:hypothetical protein